jgi:endonuclease-3 related protein
MAPANPRPKYADYQAIFHKNLPPDTQLYNEFHALWDRHAKDACAKTPVCEGCCLLDLCPTGQKLMVKAGEG